MRVAACVVRRSIAFFFMIAAIQTIASIESLPFKNLSQMDIDVVKSGNILFRQPSNWRDLAAPSDMPSFASLDEDMRHQRPNYLGEVIMMIPVQKDDNLPVRLGEYLSDPQNLLGIKYWSKQNKQYFDLFDKVVELSRSGDLYSGRTEVLQHMDPFSEYKTKNEWTISSTGVLFSSVNLSPLSYKGNKAVTPGDLTWRLVVYQSGDRWILYGLGSVNAFDFFGLLRDRLSNSFLGRIEAFFSATYMVVR